MGFEENIVDPEPVPSSAEVDVAKEESCAVSARMKCHVKSTCSDQPAEGFCCTCEEGYYGNGYNCLRNDAPLRVTGTATGIVNGEEVNAQFQSYVILLDGRSYSALSPLPAAIGHLFQLVPNLGESIGWLFAKTANGRQNGYQLTGGIVNRTVSIRFGTGESLQLDYQFKGLNVWDQLNVDMTIAGEIPEVVAQGVKVNVPDALNTYYLRDSNTLTLSNQRTIIASASDQPLTISYEVEEVIRFESCPYKALEIINQNLMERVFKASVSYEPRDQALRVNMLNKVGDFAEGVNPCNEGAICGENSICVAAPNEEIGYECQCLHGYTVGGIQGGISYCVDINECASPSDNICDVNAECINMAGGYACKCGYGFSGNGYQCTEEEDLREVQHATTTTTMASPREEDPRQVDDDCTDESCNFVPPEEEGPGDILFKKLSHCKNFSETKSLTDFCFPQSLLVTWTAAFARAVSA